MKQTEAQAKVTLRTHYFTYEFATSEYLRQGLTSQSSLEAHADVIYDKQKQRFVKCRYMRIEELNAMLELTRG